MSSEPIVEEPLSDSEGEERTEVAVEEGEPEQVREWTEEEIAERLALAAESKAKGNEAFRAGDNEAAVAAYSDALGQIHSQTHPDAAVFFGNRAAAHFNLKALEEALHDCTASLAIKPDYVKVLVRRAKVHEAREEWTEALRDYRAAAELEPETAIGGRKEKELEKKAEAKLEKEKEEMMGKLKDIGNKLLGKFGLSTDNFNFVKDDKTGGYSMNFSQSPGAAPSSSSSSQGADDDSNVDQLQSS